MKTTPKHQAMFAFAALVVLIAGAPVAGGAPAVARTVQPAPLDALFKAAIEGDVVRVRTLLNQGADVNARNPAGATLLMSAVSIESRYEEGRIGHSQVVSLLLSRGADVNAADKVGQTALMKALTGYASEWKVIGATTQIVRLLLAQGARVNVKDQEGRTPLVILLSNWDTQAELVQLLLSKGADVNARTKDATTALMVAAEGDRKSVV